ncbi:MAG: alpha/beta hydrolase [Myxococcota bacterium]
MDYDHQSFVLAEDRTRLFFGVRGAGETLVLNDGIGCDGFAWKYLQPALAKTHRVVHWHYRGHGRSGPPADAARLDVPTLARDLRHVLDETDTGKAVLFGHSMGTQVALEFYRQFPDRTAGLVLICGTYGKVTETFHGTDVLKTVLPRLIEYARDHRDLSRALWGRVPAGLAFRLARLSGEVDGLTIREEDFRVYWDHINLIAWDVFLPMLRLAGEHSAEDLLERISVPTLVVAAENDTFTPKELAKEMAERIPKSDYLLLAGASHASPVEQPEAILKRVRHFLAH